MLMLAAHPAKFITFHVDAFTLSQLQRSLYLNRASLRIEPLCELPRGWNTGSRVWRLGSKAPAPPACCGVLQAIWTGPWSLHDFRLNTCTLRFVFWTRQDLSSESSATCLSTIFGLLSFEKKKKMKKSPCVSCSVALFVVPFAFLDSFLWFSLTALPHHILWGWLSSARLPFGCLESSCDAPAGNFLAPGRLGPVGRCQDGF